MPTLNEMSKTKGAIQINPKEILGNNRLRDGIQTKAVLSGNPKVSLGVRDGLYDVARLTTV